MKTLRYIYIRGEREYNKGKSRKGNGYDSNLESKGLSKARYALQGAGIKYSLITKNLSAVNRSAPPIAQGSHHNDAMYYLYVHKKDEDMALHVIQEAIRSF